MSLGEERSAVQNPLITYATEIGWEYISPDEALRLRGGNTGFVFKNIFVNQMQRLNPFMDHIHAEEIIKSLERIPSNGNISKVSRPYSFRVKSESET